MTSNDELGELILNFDPLAPAVAHAATATEFVLLQAQANKLPHPIPWPADGHPKSSPLAATPDEHAPLPQAEVLVVTWTAAEARALADLFTPGYQLESWYQYRHNVEAFIPKITGQSAPFNTSPKNGLYYHSLGLYFPCLIGGANVLCLKSGLHMDYDGPLIPIKDWWLQLVDEVKPKLIITTGTGGGIGSDIKLGDVIIGGAVRFHCTKQFADSAFKEAIFETTKFGKSAFELITAEMRDANAEEFNAENASPLKFAYPGSAVHKTPKIVTTDFFEFDDTLDSAHLQALGQACDMGDASLGLALDTLAHPPKWTAIRNASDGQMDGTLSKEEQRQKAAAIYKRYGLYTSVGSILATWAVIRDSFPDAAASTAATAVTTTADTAATYNGATTALAETSLSMQARSRVPRPHSTSESLLLTLLAGSERQSTDATGAVVSSAVSETIKRTLPSGLQDLTMLAKEYTFVDELRQERRVQLVNASASVPLSCRGTYVFENENLVCKLVVPETPEGK